MGPFSRSPTASSFEFTVAVMASRYLFSRGASLMRSTCGLRQGRNIATTTRVMSEEKTETDDEFDSRYVAYFNRKDIDGWEIRKAFQELVDEDLVPDPTIVAAALRACRRVNDYSLTTRILEITEQKSQINKEIWPYMIQELKPTLDELGILTPEEMGYNKPELWMPNPYEA